MSVWQNGLWGCSVCLSLISICMSVRLSNICSSVCLSYMSVRLSNMSVRLSNICSSVCLSYMSVCLSVSVCGLTSYIFASSVRPQSIDVVVPSKYRDTGVYRGYTELYRGIQGYICECVSVCVCVCVSKMNGSQDWCPLHSRVRRQIA